MLSLEKAVSVVLILLLFVSSLSILFVFHTKQSTHRVFLTVEYQNGSSVRVDDNSSLGQFNFTTEEANSSCRFLFDFQEEYVAEYPHQNLSFLLLANYFLSSGRYFIDISNGFGVMTTSISHSWNSARNMLPGVLALQQGLQNSSYTYTIAPQEIQRFHISWEVNLTSEIVPKQDVLCRLTAEFTDIETSDGLSSATSITTTVAFWVIGIVVLVELNRRSNLDHQSFDSQRERANSSRLSNRHSKVP